MNLNWQKAVVLTSVAALFSCTQKPSGPPLSPLAEKGKRAYIANCIVCHNSDPRLNGAVGPAVSASSLELLQAKIIHGSYPPGYKPKRESSAMAPLPHLKNELEALREFLSSP